MEQEKFDKIVELISKQLNLKNSFSKKFISETLIAIQRFDEKHTEKGLGDYTEFGGVGVLIKMNEKFNALKRAYKEGSDVEIQDWEDCGVYSLIGKLVENKEWQE